MAKTAKNNSKTPKTTSTASQTNIVRITASDDTPKKALKTPKIKAGRSRRNPLNGLKAAGGYFKGAWQELREVRWPTRRATWGLTGAVLLFSAFFIVLILLLDYGFNSLFELILK